MTATGRSLSWLGPAPWARCIFVAVLLLGAGCRALPVTRYYVLEPPPRTETVAPSSSGQRELLVAVAVPRVEPPYDQERIAYRPPGVSQEIAFYQYHRWSAPPARLAQNALALALDRLPGIAAEPERDGAAYDLLLRTVVLRLEEVDSASGISTLLELDWSASDAKGSTRAGEARFVEAVASPEVDAVVTAFATAVERAANEIGRELLGDTEKSP